MATTLTYTAGDLCELALEEAGIADVERPAAGAETERALKRLNMMLKAFQNRNITVWKQATDTITVTAATESYVISSRPLTLDLVSYNDTSTDRWMERMARRDYFELPDRAAAGTPTQFYYQREREQGTLYVWPVLASATGTFRWVGRNEIEDITDVSDTVDVPGEWYEAVHYGLAQRLAGHFGRTERLMDLTTLAREALQDARATDYDGSVFFVGEQDQYG